jgi:hypothetical protein
MNRGMQKARKGSKEENRAMRLDSGTFRFGLGSTSCLTQVVTLFNLEQLAEVADPT